MRVVWVLSFLFVSIAFAAERHSPYTGQEKREIKALSAEEVEDYLSGHGLGLAKAAELNHYPGPLHVLELSDKLKLSEQQRQRTQAIFDDMKSEALPLGEQLLDKERELDSLFASQKVSQAELERLVGEIAILNGKLRAAHLRAHLAQQAVLTAEQIGLYDRLRGYDVVDADKPRQQHRGH
jgi:Spy/CpxP family protein refolding chaperone